MHEISVLGRVDPNPQPHDLETLAQHLANLIAAGCSLGWEEGCPSDISDQRLTRDDLGPKAVELPFQYYSEVFNALVIPAEEPVTGDIVDDIIDIYSDIHPGLKLYDIGKKAEAVDHWRFWFHSHWGEHATSAIRAVWSYLSGQEGGAEL